MREKRWVYACMAALLLVMVCEVALSTRRMSASWDEGDHIYSGYRNWTAREYANNPEHPPLVKLVATLPLLPLDLKLAPRENRYFKSEAYYGGRELLFRNDPKYGGKYSADTLLFRVHMAASVFSLGVALLLFFAGSEMFSPVAGLVAMALWVFDPTVLTNAPYVTTDTGATFGFLAGVYAFYRFVKRMSWQRGVVAGLACGVALVSKHNAVLLLPMLLLLAAGEMVQRWRVDREGAGRFIQRLLLGMAGIAAVAIFVVWGVYSFRFAMHASAGTPTVEQEMSTLSPVMRGLLRLLLHWKLLPESYLFGMADVLKVGAYMPTFLLGKLYAHGQWWYFPALLSLKWSMGVLGLLIGTVFVLRWKQREVLYLLVPGAFYLAVAMASPLNIGVRHVLPVFAFAFALAGAGAAALIARRRVWAYPVAALLLWHAVDSVRMFPNYMPYANVLWGGHTRTHEYFNDSAVEWGQELKLVKAWTDAHGVKECWFAYFPAPFLLPSDYGVPCKLLPTLDTTYEQDIALPRVVHGPLLFSMADLNGFEYGTQVRNPYSEMFLRKPDDVIADGVAVFYGDFALPQADIQRYVLQARMKLAKDPQAALAAAKLAVAEVPRDYDANIALGDALKATGDKAGALAAYQIAQARIAEMEPTAQERWGPIVAKKVKAAE